MGATIRASNVTRLAVTATQPRVRMVLTFLIIVFYPTLSAGPRQSDHNFNFHKQNA
jgi:hypothetical protein